MHQSNQDYTIRVTVCTTIERLTSVSVNHETNKSFNLPYVAYDEQNYIETNQNDVLKYM